MEENHASDHANILVFTYNEINCKKIRWSNKILFTTFEFNFLIKDLILKNYRYCSKKSFFVIKLHSNNNRTIIAINLLLKSEKVYQLASLDWNYHPKNLA